MGNFKDLPDPRANGYLILFAKLEEGWKHVLTDECPPLERLQDIVGGYIERIAAGGTDMIVNEEGLLLGLRLNLLASAFAEQTIVGNAVLFTGKLRLE